VVSFSDVKARVSLEDAVAKLGLQLTDHSGALRGKCPACESSGTRNLVVTPGRGAFCFACKQGGDVIWLASHVKGIDVKSAAEYLAGTPETEAKNNVGPKREEQTGKGLKPLDHIQHKHQRVQELITEETAIALGVGFTNKGIMRGCVAVPIHEHGSLIAYVGIQEDGTYRFPTGFMATQHLFNAHQVLSPEVQVLPTVQDVLRAHDAGVTDCISFLTTVVSPNQVKMLADWLEDTRRRAVF